MFQLSGRDEAMSQIKEQNPWVKVLALTVGLPIIIALILFAFLAPSMNSGANELPVAVSAPEQVAAGMEQEAGDAIEVTTMEAADVVEGIENREYIGGLAMNPDMTVTMYKASGNGTPYGTMLDGMAEGLRAQGMTVNVEDLAPLGEGDATGSGLAMIGLPLAFGGMISGVLITGLLKRRPWIKVAASALVSLAAGFVVAAIMMYGYDLFEGSYFATSMAIAAGVAAISLVAVGLGELLGMAGIGLTAILVIFLSNPLSGLATGWWILPKPWGFIGQLMPIGATGNLVRSVEYFDGNGATMSIWVLICWIAVGLACVWLGSLRKPADKLNVE